MPYRLMGFAALAVLLAAAAGRAPASPPPPPPALAPQRAPPGRAHPPHSTVDGSPSTPNGRPNMEKEAHR